MFHQTPYLGVHFAIWKKRQKECNSQSGGGILWKHCLWTSIPFSLSQANNWRYDNSISSTEKKKYSTVYTDTLHFHSLPQYLKRMTPKAQILGCWFPVDRTVSERLGDAHLLLKVCHRKWFWVSKDEVHSPCQSMCSQLLLPIISLLCHHGL